MLMENKTVLIQDPNLTLRDTTTIVLNISLPQFNPSASIRSRQDEDNDKATASPVLIDTCCWDPEHQNGLHLLLLHPTILCRDAMMTELNRERVLFIGTQFSILYTSMYSPAEAATPCA